jgi:hypothetical protein
MSQMTDTTPDAGSHVAYDSVVSSIWEVGSDAALNVARTLDAEAIELLANAATP